MIVQYRGYWISGSSIPEYTQDSSRAVGTICLPARLGSIREIKTLEGPSFTTREKAEEHGLRLAKAWLDGLAELSELWVALRPKSADASGEG